VAVTAAAMILVVFMVFSGWVGSLLQWNEL
jgi:hypothetical protein